MVGAGVVGGGAGDVLTIVAGAGVQASAGLACVPPAIPPTIAPMASETMTTRTMINVEVRRTMCS